jgi:peptide/nickel transport system permease protein
VFAYIVRRLISVVITLLVTTLVTFGVFFMVPKITGSDPAFLYIGKVTSPEAIEGVRKKYGLDEPVFEQYGKFVAGIVVGRDYNNGPDKTHCPAPCFGYSFKTDQQVWSLLMRDLPVTGSLAAGAAVLWLIGGVATGVISALRRGTVVDRSVMVTALTGVSLPVYFTGTVSVLLFTYSLHWLPDPTWTPITVSPWGWFENLILPWVTLAFLFAATYARLTRAVMLETMNEDYIRTARSKGLPERTVVGKHAMRAVATPILTVFGLDLGGLLGGALLTEHVFNLPGLGQEAYNAITASDLPVILGVTMFAAFFIVVANLIVDLLYTVVDPRVRLG